MKQFINKYYPSPLTSIIAILSVICGGFAYKYIPRLTDFECLLVTVSVFMLLKGIIMFVHELWSKECGL